MSTAFVVACAWISIVASAVLKVPQIVTVCRRWSADGLSLQSILLELTGFSISLAYNVAHKYPLDSYAEYILLVAQDVLLLLIVLHLTRRLSMVWLSSLVAFGAAIASVALGYAPLSVVALLMSVALPIGWSSKVVQLKTILGTGDARTVSVATWALAAATCATRIVTTLAETADSTLLTQFVVSLVLNTLIVIATHWYRHGPVDKLKKAE